MSWSPRQPLGDITDGSPKFSAPFSLTDEQLRPGKAATNWAQEAVPYSLQVQPEEETGTTKG